MWKRNFALAVSSLALVLGLALAEEQRGPTGRILLDNGNELIVHNDAKVAAPRMKVSDPTRITYIETYHWNHKKGKEPGVIGLKHQDGTLYQWEASGRPGQNKVPNAYWFAKPNEVIKPGMYTVYDSDPATWSHNDKSNHKGFAVVRGIPEPVKKK